MVTRIYQGIFNAHGFILSLYIDISVKYLKVLTKYIITLVVYKMYIASKKEHPTETTYLQ